MTEIVERELGGRYKITREEIRGALSAKNFVAVRRVPGGPAAEALEPEIARARARIGADEHWLSDVERKLSQAREAIRLECESLLRGTDGR
jgi:argininosuccinate lyase